MSRPVITLGIVVSVLCLELLSAFSQNRTPPTDPTLLAAMKAREKSFETRDVKEWSRYTSGDFVSVNSDGSLSTKQERLKRFTESTGGSQIPHTLDSIRMFGDIAVTIEHGSSTRITYVWMRQMGTWRVVSSQSTPIVKN